MNLVILLTLLLFATVELRNVRNRKFRSKNKRDTPPEPVYQGITKKSSTTDAIAKQIAKWKPRDENNLWELSGQFEGDIMLPKPDSGNGKSSKNVISDPNYRWDKCVVPYHIEEHFFTEHEIDTIRGAMAEYHDRTCCKFREYKDEDNSFIVIRGNPTGCWSFVGRRGGGQVVNLQVPGCVRHGIVIHELLHALGFFHQQSAAERDEYVRIRWDNIKPGREHNFNKYNASSVTNFGTGYDYDSIMHYSRRAFSKNGEDTIEVLESGARIGQRDGLSRKDITKLEHMYSCNNHQRYKPDFWSFY